MRVEGCRWEWRGGDGSEGRDEASMTLCDQQQDDTNLIM